MPDAAGEAVATGPAAPAPGGGESSPADAPAATLDTVSAAIASRASRLFIRHLRAGASLPPRKGDGRRRRSGRGEQGQPLAQEIGSGAVTGHLAPVEEEDGDVVAVERLQLGIGEDV